MPTTVSIPGMHCASCKALIEDVSTEFPEIQSVEVDMATKRITVHHADRFDLHRWKAQIEGLGAAYAVHPA